MRIATNLPALSAFASLNSTNKSLQKTINALSTGLRINSASDDAAGFAISEKMRSQIRGLDTALRNSQDGISLLQTAEGALGETNSMLQRMRELAVQASNDSLTSNDRQYIQLEIEQLKDQIDRIAETTQFNRKRLLDGSCGALWSSSDLNVNLKINGGLTYIDDYGQKVSSEGNYRIEVRADAGEAQVQKSNIMNVAEYGVEVEIEKITEPITQIVYEFETVTETVTEMVKEIQRTVEIVPITTTEIIPHIIRLNEGIDSAGKTSGDGWAFENGSLVITGSGTYDIRGTGNSTSTNIIVKSGVGAKIFLTDVNIDMTRTNNAGMEIERGGSAFVYLANNNIIRGGSSRAGIEVKSGAGLILSSADGGGQTSGRLEAYGSSSGGSGIGGPCVQGTSGARAGNILIEGGTIEAKAQYGAGIGGGESSGDDGCDYIWIHGGNVTAWGGVGAAGIGTGYVPTGNTMQKTSSNTKIFIFGGTVKAYGGAYSGGSGAGIGGGGFSSSGLIELYQDLIDDGSIVAVTGGTGADKIGHGAFGSETEDTDIRFFRNVATPSYTPVPSRPTTTVEVHGQEERVVYKEIEVPRIREVTREVMKKVEKVIGERVIDEIPYARGLVNGDFIFKPKKLGEISQFYNESGKFLVSQPQTITITQGDGQTASITLYETDTIYDIAEKINSVISDTFGQGRYTDNKNKFCTVADGTEGTSESVYTKEPIYSEEGYLSEYGFEIPAGTLIGYKVYSTMLVRSAVPGKLGELYFSGDEDLLNALGLNTIHESSETEYTTSVYNAHSGKVMANGIKTTGNILSGIIPNADIEFDAMAGIQSIWDESSKRYILSDGETYSAYIHLKDNTTIFQTGANQGEDFMIQLGDTSSHSLGISGVSVVTREAASQSISTIDRAINKVSSQRANIGAYQNALEHTMNNLTTTSTNLSSAESRIRDADMSKLMMDFVKLQIMNQSGTSMLAQANQLPQSVLGLLQ